MRNRFVWILAASFVAACGPSDLPTGPTDQEPVDDPTFSGDVQGILVAGGCTAGNCHGNGAGGLVLTGSASANYGNLVNVPSDDAPNLMLVKPEDAQNSYLVMKLEGRQVAGSRMPLGRPALTNAQITTIRNWITAGAPNN